LPNSLRELWCHNNKITQIPNTLPNSLEKFCCNGIQITQIPLSIINLQQLKNFKCNVKAYKPQLVEYFLDNLKDKNIKKYCYDLIWKVRMEF